MSKPRLVTIELKVAGQNSELSGVIHATKLERYAVDYNAADRRGTDGMGGEGRERERLIAYIFKTASLA